MISSFLHRIKRGLLRLAAGLVYLALHGLIEPSFNNQYLVSKEFEVKLISLNKDKVSLKYSSSTSITGLVIFIHTVYILQYVLTLLDVIFDTETGLHYGLG